MQFILPAILVFLITNKIKSEFLQIFTPFFINISGISDLKCAGCSLTKKLYPRDSNLIIVSNKCLIKSSEELKTAPASLSAVSM
jgi:hypothetical protein